jgi:hypothetical protein
MHVYDFGKVIAACILWLAAAWLLALLLGSGYRYGFFLKE